MNNKSWIAALLIAACLVPMVRGDESAPRRWKATTGLDYSVGDYGDTEDTKILYIPAMLRYTDFPWTLKLTVPYLQIDGPGDVVGGIDGGVVVGDTTSVDTEKNSGLGDVVASVVYSIDPWTDAAPVIDLTGKAKLPTADEDKNLGTGEADYTLQVDLSKSFGAWMPFVTLGYQFMGSSDTLELDNRPYASVGSDYRVAKGTSLGAAYDWKQAATDTSDDSSEGSLYVNQKFDAGWSASLYTVAGFSDGSPAWGVGAQVGKSF